MRFHVITYRVRAVSLSYSLGEAPGPGDAEETQESTAYAHSQDDQQPQCARARVHDECVYRGQAPACSDPQEVILFFLLFSASLGQRPRCAVVGFDCSKAEYESLRWSNSRPPYYAKYSRHAVL